MRSLNDNELLLSTMKFYTKFHPIVFFCHGNTESLSLNLVNSIKSVYCSSTNRLAIGRFSRVITMLISWTKMYYEFIDIFLKQAIWFFFASKPFRVPNFVCVTSISEVRDILWVFISPFCYLKFGNFILLLPRFLHLSFIFLC